MTTDGDAPRTQADEATLSLRELHLGPVRLLQKVLLEVLAVALARAFARAHARARARARAGGGIGRASHSCFLIW